MTATYAYDEQPSSRHPLRPGASPRAIWAALLPPDRTTFDAAYEAALAESRESLDLTGLFTMLEHWRRLAVLQSDPEGYRRAVRRAAETQTGDALPAEALPYFAELRTLLEVNPWGGDPVNDQNPDGPVRTLTFGREREGLVAYLILDDLRRVDLLQVIWLG